MFDSCYASIRDTMPVTKFYTLTSFVIAAIEDGHTNCQMQDQFVNDYINNIKVFPAITMFINGRAFIACCKQNDALAETELLAINGRPMSEIIQKIFSLIQSDGAIHSRKNWEVNNNFPFLYNFLYGANDSFGVTYKTKAGEVKTTTVQSQLFKNMICVDMRDKTDHYLTLDYKPGNVAVLTIKSFFNGFLDQTHEDFAKFLAASFKELKNKKIEKLIIDIRSNQGGNDGNGIMLYSYLTQKPFRYYALQETVVKRFADSDHVNLGIHQPAENNFKGKLYILTNGRSFSASAEFSAVVKSNKRAVFIGEETGGGYYGNTSGDETYVTLPNSQIIVRIPMVKYVSAVRKAKYKDRGVIPDYEVIPTISDVIQYKDVQLDYALKLAGGN